mmetsp:Transcript_15352/g.37702  ORF Transcript_15352/g.37702 Transcript_15352/m.37702 type:complete len:209 (+) Transcript_15352:1181-1807(+)
MVASPRANIADIQSKELKLLRAQLADEKRKFSAKVFTSKEYRAIQEKCKQLESKLEEALNEIKKKELEKSAWVEELSACRDEVTTLKDALGKADLIIKNSEIMNKSGMNFNPSSIPSEASLSSSNVALSPIHVQKIKELERTVAWLRRKLKTEKERSGTDSLERVSDGNSRLSEDRLAKRLALVQSELYLERSRRFFYHVLDRLISLC